MQQHKRVSVFRPKQQVEQEPKQEQQQSQPKGQIPTWAEAMEQYQQWLEQLKREDPEAYRKWVNAPRTDETPPCVDPDE